MSSQAVTVVDSGLSNIDSIVRALQECGGAPEVVNDAAGLKTAQRIILPGVGSFSAAMTRLRNKDIDSALIERLSRDPVPLLGICLGMQLLVDTSAEDGDQKGLGIIPGQAVRFIAQEDDERIPHIGWNEVTPTKPTPLFTDLEPGKDFYFVHSYHVECAEEYVLTRTPYCGSFVSGIARDNVMGLQFHPEKSQDSGFQILRNFLAL